MSVSRMSWLGHMFPDAVFGKKNFHNFAMSWMKTSIYEKLQLSINIHIVYLGVFIWFSGVKASGRVVATYISLEIWEMAKSLSEQILDIANKPVNQDLDIENEDTTLFEHKRHNRDDSDSDGSSSEDENNNASEHYVKVGKSKFSYHELIMQG